MVLAALIALVSLQPASLEIGEVDLFGQTGLDEAAIRRVIPFHPGQTLTFDEILAALKR